MVTCLASSADGEFLLSGSVDGKVLLFQIGKKKLLQTFVHSVSDDDTAAAAAATGNIPLPITPVHPDPDTFS